MTLTLPDIVQQHIEAVSSLWQSRDQMAGNAIARLHDLAKFDERLDANIDGLRIAGPPAWPALLEELGQLGPGAFFGAAVFAIELNDVPKFELVIARTHDADDKHKALPPIPRSRPWRGVASATAWAERSSVANLAGLLLQSRDPPRRLLGVTLLGLRRATYHFPWGRTLTDSTPLVRTRAYRTIGQLGRADLMAHLRPGLADPDPECRFWAAWAAARMGATEPLDTLADIAWTNLPRADRALDLLLRRLDVPQANAWLREFAKLPDRQRSLIRATGVIGDPLYIPWLIERMADPATARLAGESFSMITGLDLAYRDLDRRPPADFQSGPNDDPADENVALDEDENLPWPDPERIGQWWTANRSRFSAGTPHFLGAPKATADWLEALSDAFQRQRHAAALELAIRQPNKAMFEVRARGRLQRQLLARARGSA
jgi:uncharacterized protein (TIGR02270 family)